MLIRGGRVVTATGEDDADVLIEDGRIAAIGASGTLDAGDDLTNNGLIQPMPMRQALILMTPTTSTTRCV